MIEVEWPYLDPLRKERINWNCWWGRRHGADSTWLTDGTMAVLRSSVTDPTRAEKLDATELAPEVQALGKLEDGTNVARYLNGIPLHRSYPAEWLGSWVRPGNPRYVTLGNPGLATYDVDRVRIAHLLVEFDDARWIPFREKKTGEAYPLVLLRKTVVCGLVCPVRLTDTKVPHDVMSEARRRWPI